MVKFSDLKNGETNAHKPGDPKERSPSRANSRLSFRQLAAEHKQALPTDKIVSEKKVADKIRSGESGEALYQTAAVYLKQVFDAVKRRKMFSLDPGLQIIRQMVEISAFQNDLFIEALHFDAPLQFIIQNNINVAVYAIKMAENLGFGKDRQVEIGMAGLLHDIGMALIPEKLIFKQQRLSEAEFKIFKERSHYSYKILKSLGDDDAYLAECALQVNERLDGSGYPLGLKGDEINEYAQIIGLVDMYEALIHSRPQRVKFHHFIAVKEIIKSGKHLFQRQHLKALLNIFSIFPLHSYVRLNSSAIGRVVDTYPDLPMRPKLQIVFDSQQRRVLTERHVNLPDDPLLYIIDSVSNEELQQLVEGTHKETRVHADRVPEDNDSDLSEAETVIGEDELPLAVQELEEEHVAATHKISWLKPVLIIGAVALMIVGLIILFGNQDSKLFDAGKLQEPVMIKAPDSTSVRPPAAVSPSPRNENQVPKEDVEEKSVDSQPSDLQDQESSSQEDAIKAPDSTSVKPPVAVSPSPRNENKVPPKDVEEKPVDSQPSDLQDQESSSQEDAIKAPQTNSRQAEKALTEKEQESISVSRPTETEPLASSREPVLNTESIKQFYPYAIKLTYFRTREAAEKSLAVYRKKGLSPYWVKVNLGHQGVWYRVFAGHFKSVEQAENSIKARNLTNATVKKTRYATLIGVYRAETDANKRIQFVSKRGFSPYVVQQANSEFYVYVGAFYTRKGAQDQSADLTAAGINNEVVER